MIAAWVATGLSVVGLVQALLGAVLVGRFTRQRAGQSESALPSVTVLKPLHGNEPLLEEALTGVCRQDYPEFQIVFGVRDEADTALLVVRRLRKLFPACDIAVVIDKAGHGLNPKVENLINMLPSAKYNVLVISDSDVHVAPDWLRRLVEGLERPGVGLVTTVYAGRPAFPLAKLGAMQINHYFLPGALMARAMGRQDCLGATMMLRRETLDHVGGFAALVNHLADDNVLGLLVQRLGLGVWLADTVPETTVSEATLGALWRHEIRWARTIRALVPAQFAASVLQYPLVWAMLAILLSRFGPVVLAWFLAAWGLRASVAREVDRALGLPIRTSLWLLPVRELMSVAVLVASYTGRQVDWRGHTLKAEGFNPR